MLLLACAPAWAESLSSPLPEVVSTALGAAGIPTESVGVWAQRVDESVPLVAWQADKPFNPASTMKLLTTFAALDLLGPAHRFVTEVFATTEPRDGVLEGDLILRGGGDPSLTIERLWLLIRELRALGLRVIRGQVTFDQSLYDLALPSEGFDATPWAAYNVAPAPLLTNFNALSVRLSVSEDRLAARPEGASLAVRVDSEVVLDDAPCNGWRERITPGVKALGSIAGPAQDRLGPSGAGSADRPGWGNANPPTIVLRGSYARACGERRLFMSLLPAHVHAGLLFRELWREAGGSWSGEIGTGRVPEGARTLARVMSPPLAELVRDINKYSNNLMARMVYLALGLHAQAPPATLDKSASALRAWLGARDLGMSSLIVDNGSGLSRGERISAGDMARLLRAAHASRHAPEFLASLPLLGVDGTLAHWMKNPTLLGRARLKTGTLADVKAWAGFFLDRTGHTWLTVFFVNHPLAESAVVAQDALLEWLDNNTDRSRTLSSGQDTP